MAYAKWVARSLDLLGLTAKSISQGKLGEWYVRPVDNLLTAKEQADLFSAVREKLLTDRKGMLQAILREQLQELDGTETVPLLLAMSLVARKWGRSADYWPQLTEYLFDNEIGVGAVRGLAHEFTAAWRRLYKFSRGTLHFPTEGKAHIKWPLTHAGLLSDEEYWVRSFGRYLLTQVGGDPSLQHPVLLGDVDEFKEALLTWLHERSLSFRSLYRRLESAQTGLTVASIAQRLLQDAWVELASEGMSAEAGTPHRAARVRLRFDPDTLRLAVVLSDGQWGGRIPSVDVDFDGGKHAWPVAYNPSQDVTFATPITLPISSPDWSETIMVKIGQRRHQNYATLSSPFGQSGKGALLFDSVSGYRVRVMQPDEVYFLLLNQDLTTAGWLDMLFRENVRLRPLVGAWSGLAAFRVTAQSVAALAESVDENLLAQLATCQVLFRPPSDHELGRAHYRLVGAVPVVDPTLPDLTYSIDDAPVLMIEGSLPFGLRIVLQHLAAYGGRYEAVQVVHLPTTTSSTPKYVSLFDGLPEPGQYRLDLGTERLSFRLVSPQTPPSYRYDLTLEFVKDGECLAGQTFGLHLLEAGQFKAHAWPGALLSVAVRHRHGINRFPAQAADSEGDLSFSLGQYFLGGLPAAPLHVSVEHGPAGSRSLTFSDQPYIQEWEVRYYPNEYVFTGRAALAKPGEPISLLLFGDEPWSGQLMQGSGQICGDTTVRVTLRRPTWQVRYVAVSRTHGPSDCPMLAARLPEVPERKDAWRLGGAGAWDQWLPWMEWLHTQPVVEREIQHLAAFSKVMWVLRNHFARTEGPKGGWMPPAPVLWQDLPALLEFNSAPRLTLAGRHRHPADPGQYAPSRLTEGRAPGLPIERAVGSQILAGKLPAEGLPVAVREQSWFGQLHVLPGDRPDGFVIRADEHIIQCNSCGRILPFRAMNCHERPLIRGEIPCNELTELFPGDVLPADLLVEWVPVVLAETLVDMFTTVLETGKLRHMPPPFTNWVKEILALRPKGPGAPPPMQWFREVIGTAAAMTELLAYPSLPVDGGRLMPLTPVFDRYPTAVLKVVDRLILWLGEVRPDARSGRS